MVFHFNGWVFGDLGDDIGILDGDNVICNDFLLDSEFYILYGISL